MTGALRRGEVKELLVEHVGETVTVIAPVLLSTETPEDVARRKVLAAIATRAAASSTRPPRWPSAKAALREWARQAYDGAVSKAPSSTHARMISEATQAVKLQRARAHEYVPPPEKDEPMRYDQLGAEWIVEVSQALAEAFIGPWPLGQFGQSGEVLPVEACRALLILHECGKPVERVYEREGRGAPGEDRTRGGARGWRKASSVAWPEQTPEQLADDASARYGVTVTVRDVKRIVSHGRRRVTDYLAGDESNPRGLVPARTRREHEETEDMASKDPDLLVGEKAIALHLGLESVSSVREWRAKYGLPIHKTPSGRVFARKSEVDPWLAKRDEWAQRLAGAQ